MFQSKTPKIWSKIIVSPIAVLKHSGYSCRQNNSHLGLHIKKFYTEMFVIKKLVLCQTPNKKFYAVLFDILRILTAIKWDELGASNFLKVSTKQIHREGWITKLLEKWRIFSSETPRLASTAQKRRSKSLSCIFWETPLESAKKLRTTFEDFPLTKQYEPLYFTISIQKSVDWMVYL